MAGIRKAGLVFNPTSYEEAARTGNYSTAMGNAQLGALFNELDAKSPDYGDMQATFLQGTGALDRTNLAATADLHSQGLANEGFVGGKKIIGKAADAAAKDRKDWAKRGAGLQILGTAVGAAIGLSDESTKTNIEPIENALEILRGLKPVSFHYNEDYSCTPERLHYGFIAQDYAKVMPDATYYDESIDKLAIDRTELIGLLVRAVQQLEGRITRMEAKQVLEEIK